VPVPSAGGAQPTALLPVPRPQTSPAAQAVTSQAPPQAKAPAEPAKAAVSQQDTSAATPSEVTSLSTSDPATAPKQPQQSSNAPQSVILPTTSKREVTEAKKQFEAGLRYRKKGNLDEAFTKFSSASELDPRNVDYVTAREFTREELTMKAIQAGNKAMLANNQIVATGDFQRALQYDPTNEYALERLRDALPQTPQVNGPVSVVQRSTEIIVQPETQHHDFHFHGDSKTLLTEVTRAYGITAEFDESVKAQHVHYDIQNVNFATAVEAAEDVSKTFYVALSAKQVLFLADTVENRRQFERMGLQTFYLSDLTDQELTEMTNALRVLLELRFISSDKGQSSITIRAPWPVLDAADHLIASLTTGRPEVLLDMRVYAVSTSLAKSLGNALPTQFTMFNISPALLAGLGASGQNLINQLIASGGINQANSTAISALLAQLQNSMMSSLLTEPFVTFGGGLTLFGINAGGTGVTPTFSLNSSDIREMDHVLLRASHNDPAVLKIGERYPIVNATFAPIYNSSSIAGVIGNQSYTAPFPSFTYEDLGINLKDTPWIHSDKDVTMKIELQIRSLGSQTNNGIPIINNREYTGTITVKDSESSVVTGMIDVNDSLNVTGYPYLGQIPGLGYGASLHNTNISHDELLVVITPHILRMADEKPFAVEIPPH